jgi:6-pyruvoyltetrahydropterin/6-carboxytetrahydropterin synthase
MYRIGKRFAFEAAHHLAGLPAGHKCARVHGHSYTAEYVLASDQLIPPGFIADFADLAPAGQYIAEMLDHHDLNEVLGVEPTAEAIAGHLAAWFTEHLAGRIPGRLVLVRVWETASSYAEYVPGEHG